MLSSAPQHESRFILSASVVRTSLPIKYQVHGFLQADEAKERLHADKTGQQVQLGLAQSHLDLVIVGAYAAAAPLDPFQPAPQPVRQWRR
jgi:hypothetical protein